MSRRTSQGRAPQTEVAADEYPADPAPRSSVSARYRMEQRQQEDPAQRGFGSRFAAGVVGALIVIGAGLGAAWLQIDAAWAEMIEGVGFPAWQGYGVMVCLYLFGVLIVGVIAALHDRSLWRCLLIGAAWAALIQIGVAYSAAFAPIAIGGDNVTVGAAMSQTGLAPVAAVAGQIAAERDAAVQAAKEQADLLATVEAERDTAIAERDAAVAEAASAAEATETVRAELAAEQTKLEAELTAAGERLAAAEAAGAEVTAEAERLRQRLVSMQADLDAATAVADQATKAEAQLESQLTAAETKAEAAMRALEQVRANAAALKTLSTTDAAAP